MNTDLLNMLATAVILETDDINYTFCINHIAENYNINDIADTLQSMIDIDADRRNAIADSINAVIRHENRIILKSLEGVDLEDRRDDTTLGEDRRDDTTLGEDRRDDTLGGDDTLGEEHRDITLGEEHRDD